jgi:predicted acetyltransferase
VFEATRQIWHAASPMIELVVPHQDYLPSYAAALRRGWSPNNERPLAASQEELAQIEANPAAFVASLDDPEAKGAPVAMPDGSVVPRLPGFRRWMWDGEFAGSIGFRWQRGTVELPPYCLGHVGYAVVPWKQRQGYATAALLHMLDEARQLKLPYIEVTADPDNLPSQKVILAAGGQLHERFNKPPQFGGKPCVRFRIALV